MSPTPVLPRRASCVCGGGCPKCLAADAVSHAFSSPGAALDPPLRRSMESAFGRDFSAIRIHTGPESDRATRSVAADAYTVGNHIVFSHGRYAPSSPEGRRLLAHELAHTVQQSGGLHRQARTPDSLDDPGLEAKAIAASDNVIAGRSAGQIAQAGSAAPHLARQESGTTAKPEKKKPEPTVGVGSPLWPWKVVEDLLIKLPQRWQDALKRAEQTNDYALFDPEKSRKLVYQQVVSFFNIFYAGTFTGLSKNKPDFSTGLKMAESMSGVADTYLNLVSLVLKIDLKKYLEDELPDLVVENLLWAILYGLVLQGGIVGATAALESDLDFTTIITPALKKFTEAPSLFARSLTLGNIPDPRWSYPFWSTPSGFTSGLTGMKPEATSQTFSISGGVNIAGIAGLYPKEEEKKPKYTGFELYPYGTYSTSWAKEGQAEPAETGRYLLGAFGGYGGLYGFAEGGQRFGAIEETYLRQGLMARGLGPLSMFQISAEESKRGGDDWAARLNAAARLQLLDYEQWKLSIGAGIGGLVTPSPGGVAVPRDYSGELSFGYYTQPSWSTEKLRTGFDAGFTSRPADPFSAEKGSLFSIRTGVSLLDFIKISVEYHEITGAPIELNLPTSDVRIMISPGPGIFYFK